jgi:integration host factor subunit alpha
MSGADRMRTSTVTRADLCEAVHKRTTLSNAQSAATIGLVFMEITNRLERGETVKLSSFGSLPGAQKRKADWPKSETGKELLIPPHRVVVFKPSAILKQRVQRGTGPSR